MAVVKMKNIALILSGCGVYDGAEIHESVLTMLAIERQGGRYQCFAPDREQYHVVDHLTGEVEEKQQRNILTEAARIARGDIRPLSELNSDEFDGLIVPGGFGVAKNLSDFAMRGEHSQIASDVLQACEPFSKQKKAAGYLCIAPALLIHIYGEGVKLTIGQDVETAEKLIKMGAEHIVTEVDQIVVDERYNLVTSPAYMLGASISEVAASVDALVGKVMSLS